MIKINGQELKIEKFPNGESLIKTKDIYISETNEIEFKFQNNEDLINLMFLMGYIDENYPYSKNILSLKYVPYSRMDRVKGNEVFTLKYFTNFINDMLFDKVIINEPHSHVCTALLNNVEVHSHINYLVKECKREINFGLDDFIYFPDTTAQKRQEDVLKPRNFLTGLKHRDFESGEITSLEIIGDKSKNTKGKKVIMVDDLSSKGTSFIKGAEKLKEMGFKEIYLVVEHCEDTIMIGDIFKTDLIDKVYTTNSILHDSVQAKKLAKDNRLRILSVI